MTEYCIVIKTAEPHNKAVMDAALALYQSLQDTGYQFDAALFDEAGDYMTGDIFDPEGVFTDE